MANCRWCTAEFEPVYEGETMCWLCEYTNERDYEYVCGNLESQQWCYRLVAGSDNTSIYWGEIDTSPDDDIPF